MREPADPARKYLYGERVSPGFRLIATRSPVGV